MHRIVINAEKVRKTEKIIKYALALLFLSLISNQGKYISVSSFNWENKEIQLTNLLSVGESYECWSNYC